MFKMQNLKNWLWCTHSLKLPICTKFQINDYERDNLTTVVTYTQVTNIVYFINKLILKRDIKKLLQKSYIISAPELKKTLLVALTRSNKLFMSSVTPILPCLKFKLKLIQYCVGTLFCTILYSQNCIYLFISTNKIYLLKTYHKSLNLVTI